MEERNTLSFNDLFANNELKELELVFDEGVYVFKYKDLAWHDRMELATKCLDMSGSSPSIDMATYYEDALLLMLDPSTFPNLSRTTLRALDAGVMDSLVQIVPVPWGNMLEEGNLKKK